VFKSMRIGVMLGIAIAVVTGIFAATLLTIGLAISGLTQDINQIDEISLPFVMVADEMDLGRSEVQQFLTDVSATHDRDGYRDAEESAKRFLNGVEKFKELYRRENDTNNLKQIEAIEADFNKFYATGKVMAEAYITNGVDAGNLLMKGAGQEAGFDRESETISSDLKKFRNQQVSEANKITTGALSAANSTMFGIILGGLIAAGMSVIFGIWIVRAILGKLGGEPAYAADVVSRIADGDLTVEVQTKAGDNSSMLFAIKSMAEKLTGIITGVRNTTESITVASKEVVAGNIDLSQRTEQQASSLEETASSMEELASTVKQNAENTQQANQLAVSASDIAVKGGQVMTQVKKSMTSISGSTGKVIDIMNVIKDIAFQTNILALNAAVEAAHAGEKGRGFAVVAAEVRNLAQRSAAAAREISALIEDSTTRIYNGSKEVDQAGTTMNDIVQAAKRVTDIMAEIAAASSEQSSGIEQVNQALIQMDEVTQQNAALVEAAAAAAELMQEQANKLYQAVGVFRVAGDKEGAQRIAVKMTSLGTDRHTVPRRVATPHATAVVSPLGIERGGRGAKEVKQDKGGEWKEF